MRMHSSNCSALLLLRCRVDKWWEHVSNGEGLNFLMQHLAPAAKQNMHIAVTEVESSCWKKKKKQQKKKESCHSRNKKMLHKPVRFKWEEMLLPQLSDYAWKALTWLLECHNGALSLCQPTHSWVLVTSTATHSNTTCTQACIRTHTST